MKFSEQNGEFDDKLKSAVEQQNNASHLSEDVGPCPINDSWFFEDFEIFLYGAVGTF